MYILVRRIQHPDFDIVIDPSEGEDAKVVYPTTSSKAEFVEFVQYKKHEKHPKPTPAEGDDWNEGKIGLRHLKKWVELPRSSFSPLDLVASDQNIFFTAVVFGNLDKAVRRFQPAVPTVSSFREYCLSFSTAFPVNHSHRDDPIPASHPQSFGTPESRRKIRVLRFGIPAILEVQCRLCVELFHGVSRRRSADIVQTLVLEIEKREENLSDVNRVLTSRDITQLISAGADEMGLWRDDNQRNPT